MVGGWGGVGTQVFKKKKVQQKTRVQHSFVYFLVCGVDMWVHVPWFKVMLSSQWGPSRDCTPVLRPGSKLLNPSRHPSNGSWVEGL